MVEKVVSDKKLGINVNKQLNEISKLKSENVELQKLYSSLSDGAVAGKADSSNGAYLSKAYRELGVRVADAMNMAGGGYNYVSALKDKLREKDQTISNAVFRANSIDRNHSIVKSKIKEIIENNKRVYMKLELQVANKRKEAMAEYIKAQAAVGVK